MQRLAATASLALLLAACGAAPSRAPAAPVVPAGYAQHSLKQLMGDNLCADIPVRLDLPQEFVLQDVDADQHVWIDPADRERVLQKQLPQHAFVMAKISMNFGYQRDKGWFADGGGTEKGFIAYLEQQGYTDVHVKTGVVRGYPVMMFESTLSNGTHTTIIYVATLISTNTVFIYYRNPGAWTDQDVQRRDTLVQSLFAEDGVPGTPLGCPAGG